MQNRSVPSFGPADIAAKHLTVLDGLRGCAVLMVLSVHFTGSLVQPHGVPAAVIKKICSSGWIGVDLFFVISGFLITSLLHAARDRNNYFVGFYARRALRILPLYYGALIVTFTLPWLLDSPDAVSCRTSWSDQLWYWVHLQNFYPIQNGLFAFVGHFWSLAIEEQFYFIWPLIILLPGRWPLTVCIACIILSFGLRVAGLYLLTDIRALYFCTFTRLDGLGIGAMVALLARHKNDTRLMAKFAVPVASVALLVLVALFVKYRWLDPGAFAVIMVGYLAIAVLFGAVLVHVLNFPWRWPCAILNSRGPRFFGRYSYALYVFHVPVIVVLKRSGVTPENFLGFRSELLGLLGYCLVSGGITVGCALGSWHLCEKHFLRLKYRLFPRQFLVRSLTEPALAACPLLQTRED
jgi:peptidoglycan/LPS O-acetylase OafA/YrhL